MGKGPPGGRRQAGGIDYRTEPNSSLPPDRPGRVGQSWGRAHACGSATAGSWYRDPFFSQVRNLENYVRLRINVKCGARSYIRCGGHEM